MTDDDPPELADFEPTGDRPLRSPHVVRVMRVVIVLGILGLILPTLAATLALQARTAQALCAAALAEGSGLEPRARFDLVGPGGPGWYCVGIAFDGRESVVGGLGLIPG